MLVGKDFEKIEFELFDLKLLEPNTFIGDLVLFLLAMYFVYKTSDLKKHHQFFRYWHLFFLIIGLSFLSGGFGHLMYNYWGVPGKYPPWLLGFIAIYFVEQAMISFYHVKKKKDLFVKLSTYKLFLFLVIEILLFVFYPLSEDPVKGLILPSVSSFIGLFLTIGLLGYHYQKTIHPSFKYLWISTIVLLPSLIFHVFKINIHPWLDKNDLSHLLLLISLVLYYLCIKSFSETFSANKDFA